MSKTLTISDEVYDTLITISSNESIKQKKRVSINAILTRDYIGVIRDEKATG